jgi:hypothetical protein
MSGNFQRLKGSERAYRVRSTPMTGRNVATQRFSALGHSRRPLFDYFVGDDEEVWRGAFAVLRLITSPNELQLLAVDRLRGQTVELISVAAFAWLSLTVDCQFVDQGQRKTTC